MKLHILVTILVIHTILRNILTVYVFTRKIKLNVKFKFTRVFRFLYLRYIKDISANERTALNKTRKQHKNFYSMY